MMNSLFERDRACSTATSLLVPLEHALEVGRFGGKAANLARVWKMGLEVPRGYVVPEEMFQQFLDTDKLRDRSAKLLCELDPQRLDSARKISSDIRKQVLATPLPDDLLEALQELHEQLLVGSVLAVRSSAVGEDSHAASFAGQLDSFLNIRSVHELKRAVHNCWASYWSDRSLFYQASKQVRLNGMAIIVQEQVDARFSGVLFTQDPQGGDTDSMRGEYCAGLGEDLVAGRTTPQSFSVQAGKSFKIEQQETNLEVMPDRWIQNLVKAGCALQQEFDAPQDIEWSVDPKGRLFVLQSRPITVSLKNETAMVWSNANVYENFPEPISPFLYSFAREGYTHYFRNLGRSLGVSMDRLERMKRPLQNIIGVHAARMYYNLTNIHRVLREAPLGDALVGSFDQFVGSEGQMPDDAEKKTNTNKKRLGPAREVVWIALKTFWQYWLLPKRVAVFEAQADLFGKHTHPQQLAGKTLIGLGADLERFLDIRCNRWNNAALADAAAMVCYGALKRLLEKEFPEDSQASHLHSLLKGLPSLVSNQPVIALWELSEAVRSDRSLMELFESKSSVELLEEIRCNPTYHEFNSQLETYLDRWGFRCSGELMLTVPNFQEQPQAVLELLKTYLSKDSESPIAVLKRLEKEREEETHAILKQIGRRSGGVPFAGRVKQKIFRTVLGWTQQAIAFRERVRFKQALLYSRVRRIALEMGQRLQNSEALEVPDDIFFLTTGEVLEWTSGRSMFSAGLKNLVQVRKNEHNVLSKENPPETFVLPEGVYWQAGIEEATDAVKNLSSDSILKGTGACAGAIRARAVVLESVTEAGRLSPGDVLVTRQTDPGWGPVFCLIKGLVIERGGMLSHGAILAREFGIPTVVGVKDAVRSIPDGANVHVDGDRGCVHVSV